MMSCLMKREDGGVATTCVLMCSVTPLCCCFLASREYRLDGQRERVSPTGGSNNLKDSGLCRKSPTEFPGDQILQFRSKPLLFLRNHAHKHTSTRSQIYSNRQTHFHSAPFDYTSVS